MADRFTSIDDYINTFPDDVQVTLREPMPYDLIGRVAALLVKERVDGTD